MMRFFKGRVVSIDIDWILAALLVVWLGVLAAACSATQWYHAPCEVGGGWIKAELATPKVCGCCNVCACGDACPCKREGLMDVKKCDVLDTKPTDPNFRLKAQFTPVGGGGACKAFDVSLGWVDGQSSPWLGGASGPVNSITLGPRDACSNGYAICVNSGSYQCVDAIRCDPLRIVILGVQIGNCTYDVEITPA